MLSEAQLSLIRARFPHFDAAKCGALFHPEQPADHFRQHRGQGRFPAVLFRNGVWWYVDRAQRPLRQNGETMKSEAPRGTRAILYTPDVADAPELIVVEGEGHLVALASLGFQGVICAGGVHGLLGKNLAEQRRSLFNGRSVRILFDGDDAGRAGATKVAERITQDGAARVCIADLTRAPEYQDGQDVEDYLGAFGDPVVAAGNLMQALGAASWETEQAEAEEEDAPPPAFVQSARLRVPGEDFPVLLAAVYDEETREAKLAVFGPVSLGSESHEQAPRGYNAADAAADEPSVALRAWRVMDSWSLERQLYVADMRGDTADSLEKRRLILPSPPYVGEDTSERLWCDLRDFMGRWVLFSEPAIYDVVASYVFLTYRLQDAEFPFVPYLRFYGRPGTGKGRALDVVRSVCWRSLKSQPTADNLHRLVEYYGDLTLVFDEFHLDRGRSVESQQRLMDTLNLGYSRSDAMARIERERSGAMVPKNFSLFGPKLFAGYGHDEDEALARRTIAVEMVRQTVPEEMRLFALPPDFWSEAAAIRGRLLAWRGRKLALGMPDPRSARARTVNERIGVEVGQVLWALCEMVPEDLPDALENILAYAESRRKATVTARLASMEARAVTAVADLFERGSGVRIRHGQEGCGPGSVLIEAHDIANHEALTGERVTTRELVDKLRQAGIPHGRRRLESGAQRSGFLIDPSNESLVRAFTHFGVEWPRKRGGESEGGSSAPL